MRVICLVRVRSMIVFAAMAMALPSLTGCLVLDSGSGAVPVNVSNLKIQVMSGAHPVAGASIQLYEVNLTSYTGVSAARLPNPVMTDKNGLYTASTVLLCNPHSLFYLAATGGDAGGGPDSSIALMTAVGSCEALATPTIVLNEVTTVGSVYALAGFMSSLTSVSANATTGTNNGTTLALTGITNAFATVNNLVDIHTGIARAVTPGGNGVVPQARINFLGNLLASCIQSAGFTSKPCAGLAANATPSGGVAPTDTVQAILNVAHRPGSNIAALYALATVSAYGPTVTAVLSDLTLSVVYTGTGTGRYSGIAVDGYGEVWVTAQSSKDAGAVVEFSPLGTVMQTYGGGATGISNPAGIAVDPFNNVWVDNCAGVCSTGNTVAASLTKIGNGGSPITNFPEGTGPYYNRLHLLASDGQGDIYYGNYPLQKLTNAGVPVGGNYPLNLPNFSSNSFYEPFGGTSPFALDGAGNLGVGITYGKIEIYTSDGAPLREIDPGIPRQFSQAIFTGAAFGQKNAFNAVGTLVFDGYPYTLLLPFEYINPVGGIASPYDVDIVVDGQGVQWIANAGPANVSAFVASYSALSPDGGFVGNQYLAGGYQAGFSATYSIAVDIAGNVWIPDGAGTRVAEYVGAATPVTPLAVGVRDNTVAQRP